MEENKTPVEETAEQPASEGGAAEVSGGPTTISQLAEDQQLLVVQDIVSKLNSGYVMQDYVREIRVNPADVELVQGWLQELQMPQIVRQLVRVAPNPDITTAPGYIVQSQIETEWLAQNYKDLGLMDWIRSKNAPIMLTHKDLKLLFLLDGLEECKAKRKKILLP